ncbi:uncharacterized protein LOC142635094 [Castanea sativa]|uniref:uncharacterized protein LOC142635094 n=1 Tax=Castanea sativa TaxID=21020 RepID=UPI003F653B0C
MLAKQGWRLMQGKNSLLYGCFKAKYLPRWSFLEVVETPNSSFVWRSIMVSREILERGSCWRVGDGLAIRVNRDKWIPNHPTNMVIHPPQEDEWEWSVVELINWTTRTWDRQLVETKFHSEDVEAILRIPLSRRHSIDKLFWLHNREGKYSEKSGYHLAKQLWREVDSQGECLTGGGINPNRRGYTGSVSTGEACLCFSGGIQSIPEPPSCTECNGEEFEMGTAAWTPVQTQLRCSYFPGNSSVRIQGEVMASFLARGPPIADSEEAKLLACRKALEFAVDTGFTYIVVEGNNTVVMNAILSSRTAYSWLGHLYDDVKCMAAGISNLTVSYVSRTANSVAHSLAHFAKKY